MSAERLLFEYVGWRGYSDFQARVRCVVCGQTMRRKSAVFDAKRHVRNGQAVPRPGFGVAPVEERYLVASLSSSSVETGSQSASANDDGEVAP